MIDYSALFLSHGAPTLAVEPSPTQRFLVSLGKELRRPRAILCISAHWDTSRPMLTGAAAAPIIHDFFGFPEALYALDYPAPGDPALADWLAAVLGQAGFDVGVDGTRGLDHGAWVPLSLMYPEAGIPVVQLSVQSALGPEHHLRLGRALAVLRRQDVLVIGSGGATHNLREFTGQGPDAEVPSYVQEFDQWLDDVVQEGRTDEALAYEGAPSGRRNHPTPEHLLPLFVAWGAGGGAGSGELLHKAFSYGILSMTAYAWK
ncbi:MAG: class III extradiol ring-cleavage dioxygenase [Gammaproteobacteria bacterium]|jgi:4,5-DOPA dioxygenase extradiol